MTGTLPPVDPTTGFLPSGVHACTWADFVRVFVDEAPHPEHRRRRLRALDVYVDCLDELFPGATLWLDGGFVSHKQGPPFDVDVVAIVNPALWAKMTQAVDSESLIFQAWLTGGQVGYPPKTPTLTQMGGLMTHQMAQVHNGPTFPRIQPFGGRIDSFIMPANATASLDSFRRDWSKDIVSGQEKGFVEVSLDAR
jgi:hypothetical protein